MGNGFKWTIIFTLILLYSTNVLACAKSSKQKFAMRSGRQNTRNSSYSRLSLSPIKHDTKANDEDESESESSESDESDEYESEEFFRSKGKTRNVVQQGRRMDFVPETPPKCNCKCNCSDSQMSEQSNSTQENATVSLETPVNPPAPGATPYRIVP